MKQTFYIVLICLLAACGKQETVTPVLQEAERVMNARPDSALTLLQGIVEPEQLSERDFATYALLLTQANDKNYVEHTSDKLITVAINYFKKHDEPDRLAWSLYYDGIIHYELNEFLPSQTALLDAEAVATTIPDYALLGRIYENLGNIYNKQGLKDSVMPMYKKALEQHLLSTDSVGTGIAYRNIARAYLTEDLDSAECYHKQALPWLKNKNYYLSVTYNDLGVLYKQKKAYEQSNYYIKQSFALSGHDVVEINARYLNIGDNYRRLGQIDSALYYLKPCLEDSKIRTAASLSLSRLYKSMGDYQTAYTYHTQYTAYKDSVNNSKQAAALAAQLKEREKEQLQQRNTELRWQKQQSIYIGCIAVLLLLLLLLFGYRYYRRLLVRKEKQLAVLEQAKWQNQKNIAFKERVIKRLSDLITSNENRNMELKAEKDRLQKELEQSDEINHQLEHEIALLTKNTLEQQPEGTLFVRLHHSPRILSKEEWKELFVYTNRYHGAYISRLSDTYPQLTNTDLQYCCLIRLGYSYKQISIILNITPNTIYTWKRRVEPKFNLSTIKIEQFLLLF